MNSGSAWCVGNGKPSDKTRDTRGFARRMDMLVWIFREHMHAGPQARTGDGPAYKGGVSNGRNGRQDGKCGNARSTRNVGGRHG